MNNNKRMNIIILIELTQKHGSCSAISEAIVLKFRIPYQESTCPKLLVTPEQYIYNVVLCLRRIRWKRCGHPQSQKEKHRFRLKLEKIRKNRITSEKFKGSKSTLSHTKHFKNKITSIYI